MSEGSLKKLNDLFVIVADGEAPGLQADEMEASVATLTAMQVELNAEIQFLREKLTANNTRHVREYLVRRRIDEEDFMEVRYAKQSVSVR